LDQLPKSLTAGERTAQQALIEAEEAQKPMNAPVAGFDLTFSVPKSVSTLWAVADGGTQALIAQAHHAAIRDMIALLGRVVAMTRVGAEGARSSVEPVELLGVIVTSCDYFVSRVADPQLHAQIVVAIRVQSAHDEKLRTLESRSIHAAVTGLEEHYNAM